MSARTLARRRPTRLGLPLVFVSLPFMALAACGDDAPAPTEPPPNAAGAGHGTHAETTAPAEPGGPTATGSSFALVSSTAESYTAGQLGSFAIELTGREGWHVNMEYPTVVQVEGEGVSFPTARLERAQAAEFGEERVRFEVPFTPGAAGAKEVQARVQFAMCNPSNCVPEERTLTLALAVQ
ncbi:MAG: hypothetical protein H6726_27545 [Sandaracinaceae bacterium]|nr:hypothetical protein [Sandaracinaceae bacterium]